MHSTNTIPTAVFWIILIVCIIGSGFILGFARILISTKNNKIDDNPAYVILSQNFLNSYQTMNFRLNNLEKKVNLIEQKIDKIEKKVEEGNK